MTTFPKNIVEKLQVIPGGVVSLIKKGESNFRPDIPPPQPPDNPSGAMFEFRTRNGNDSELPIMLAIMPIDNSWTVIDGDTGELLVNSSGSVVDGVMVHTPPPEQQDPSHPVLMISFARSDGGTRKYKVSGPHHMMGLALMDEFNPGVEIIDGAVLVERYSNSTSKYTFSIVQAGLTVPPTLPPHLTDLSDMFSESNKFNQDLSRWNTSKVTKMSDMFYKCSSFNQDISMWNVSNVTDMDWMFTHASSFNQDLSPWCVKNILEKPDNFDHNATRWVKSRPAWGTCPGEEEVDPPYVPPVEEDVDKDTIIKAFDFALIRYRWTPTGGEDLDTRTYLTAPGRAGRKVGWSRLKNDDSYLIWNEDNQGVGVESVLIDIDKIHTDYPNEQIIELKMDGFWYSKVKSGNLAIEFATFKGGKMVPSGYDWINEGGLAIQILKLDVNTLVQYSSDIEGENLATLSYDTLLKKGTLVARDGPSVGDGGTVEPEEPEVPPTGDPDMPVEAEPMEFTVSSLDSYGGSLAFHIDLFAPQTDWSVYVNDVLAANDSLGNLEYLSKEIKSGYIRLSLKNMQGATKNIKIHGRADTIQLTHLGWGAIPTPSRTVDVTSFGTRIRNIKVNLGQCNLTVPNALPAWMTDLTNMFSGARQFNQDISMWDTSHVTKMTSMFSTCDDFNQDISKWDVSKVTNMDYMFGDAESFNQDLSGWCVHYITSAPVSFDNGTSNWAKPKPVWGTCPDIVDTPTYDETGAFKFSMSGEPDVSKMSIEMYDPSPDWVLLRDGLVVGGGAQGNGNAINFANTDKYTSEYVLIGGDFVVILNKGSWSSEVDAVDVTQFPSKAVAVRFGVEDIPLTVPTNLPVNITSLSRMFENCTAFNQDISMWDISHISEINAVFLGCASFNQPLNSWDVSNVSEFKEIFTGCTVFNQPLDNWNVSNAVTMNMMFKDAKAFNQDISGWDVSGVTNMGSMFAYASSFNQDLGKWCVTNIATKPNYFDEMISGWTKPRPVWGTCPDASGPVTDPNLIDVSGLGEPYLFNTSNMADSSKEMDLDIQIFQYTSWQLVDLDTNLVIANSNRYFAPGVVDGQSQSNTADMRLTRTKSGISNYALYAGGYGVSFNNRYRGSDTVAEFNLTQWGTGTSNAAFKLGGTTTTVPNELSPTITSTSAMFDSNNLFNQDISGWNVSGVTNMDYMFSQASSFNQDLSGWNVGLIPVEPPNFALLANAWSLPKPKWGTTGGSNPPSGQAQFNFTTSNRMASNPLPVALRVVSSGQAWSLIDVDTQTVIHEVAAGNTPGETEVLYLDELGTGAERSYVIEGAATEVSLSIDDEGRSDGFIKVESFSGDINQYKYDVKNADITVPLLLPSNVTNTDYMFQGCYNFNTDITGWDTSAITSMEGMFSGCTSFNQEIGNWDVSNVTNMGSMFEGCAVFNGDISSWETYSLNNMYAMFSDCDVFNHSLNGWDVSNVTDMGMLFSNCRTFNQPLDNWDTSSCTSFGSCFAGAHTFNQNINNWDVTNATDLNYVFSSAHAFNQPLSNWVIPELYSLESTFMEATSFNQDISNWNVSMVSDMSYMFQEATAFNKPLNAWDTSSLSYANGMFDGAHNFNQPLDNWVTSSLSRMSTMFSEAIAFNQDLSSWCVSNFDMAPHNFSSGCLDWAESKPIWGTCDDDPARTFNFTFTSGGSVSTGAKIRLLVRNLQGGWELYRNGVLVSSRTVTDARVVATPSSYSGLAILIEPVASSVENYELKLTADALELGYTANDGNLHSLAVTQFSNGIGINEFALYKVALTVPETLPTYVKSLVGMFRGSDNFNQNINAWDVSHIEEFTECFKDCTKFNQPLDTWSMTRSYSVESMFENCKAFNQDISSWDVTGQSRLLKMFSGCTNFNQSLDAWDVSNVWSFESMFSQCSSLNQDFTNWTINTSTKVNMYAMFSECTVFNGDITTWDMSMVGKTERMFTGCVAFNRDISGWNTASFSNMEYMFQNAISFNQNLSSWNVVKFPTMPYEFASNTPAWVKPKPIWGTDGQVVLPPGPIETNPADLNIRVSQLQPDTPTGISGTIIISDDATYWSVWCEGEQVAGNGISGSKDGTIKVSNRKITITNRTTRTQLAIKGYMSSAIVTIYAPTESADTKLAVDVLNFSPTIGSHQFTTRACALSVPEILPRTLNKLDNMFKMCYNITSDITGWDTSLISNMDWMFWLAKNFNQDLSGWNVEQIPVEPVNFADGTDAWVLPKPVWGYTHPAQ